MAKVIRFPVERREAQIAEETKPEIIHEKNPPWFGVRIRPK